MSCSSDQPQRSDRKSHDWVVSTTSAQHLTPDIGNFTKYHAFESVVISNNDAIAVVGIGTVRLEVYLELGTAPKYKDRVALSLKNVLHVPTAKVNVFSVQAINQGGYEVLLNCVGGGGRLQEYQEFMDNISWAVISMNGKHIVLNTTEKLYSGRWMHEEVLIPNDVLFSFEWSEVEEGRWIQLLKDNEEFDGQYIDQILELEDRCPRCRALRTFEGWYGDHDCVEILREREEEKEKQAPRRAETG